MEKEDQDNKINACIIYDEYMYFAEEVANHLGIPSIILSTSSAAKMQSYLAIPRLQNDGYIPFQGVQHPDILKLSDFSIDR